MDTDASAFAREVADARLLLDFAVASGWKSDDGRMLEDALIDTLKKVLVGLRADEPPAHEEQAAFEKAYRDLALLLSPVTAESLRATDRAYGRRRWTSLWVTPVSEGAHWSRVLLTMTASFALVAVAHTWLAQFLGETKAGFWFQVHVLLTILLPFIYGGLGACAYLLKACHVFIYKRIFDVNRKPEYVNRIALGLLGGGMIVLFVNEISDGQDGIMLSAAALGFLAGYSTDFLFQTIERVMAAILPKTGVASVQRARPPALERVSIADLLDRLRDASDPDERKAILSVLNKLGYGAD